jgi:hypothetical protein
MARFIKNTIWVYILEIINGHAKYIRINLNSINLLIKGAIY